MIARLVLAAAVALSLAACGVKSRLDPPPGPEPQQNNKDPSQPPRPMGQ